MFKSQRGYGTPDADGHGARTDMVALTDAESGTLAGFAWAQGTDDAHDRVMSLSHLGQSPPGPRRCPLQVGQAPKVDPATGCEGTPQQLAQLRFRGLSSATPLGGQCWHTLCSLQPRRNHAARTGDTRDSTTKSQHHSDKSKASIHTAPTLGSGASARTRTSHPWSRGRGIFGRDARIVRRPRTRWAPRTRRSNRWVRPSR